MKMDTRVLGNIPLMKTGYKYRSQKVLGFMEVLNQAFLIYIITLTIMVVFLFTQLIKLI